MKRKLFSTMLCALALLLLMGAGVEPGSTAPLAIEEESTVSAQNEQVLETEPVPGIGPNRNPTGPIIRPVVKEEMIEEQPVEEEEILPEEPAVVLPVGDPTFLIDGQPAPVETARELRNGVTYVALAPTVQAIDPTAQIQWNGGSATVTVTTEKLNLTAVVGQLYVVANGRYLYVADGVQLNAEGRVMVPLNVLTKAFDAKLSWDGATNTIYVVRGTGALMSGDQYYKQDDLFWLSRVIFAESGNQSMKGKMAVGNVVLNRVSSPLFPNNIMEVLSQRNQFSTWLGGRLANRTPSESCVIAAKLVMDGAVVEETRGALYFDSLVRSWAARHKTYIATLGGHKFYC